MSNDLDKEFNISPADLPASQKPRGRYDSVDDGSYRGTAPNQTIYRDKKNAKRDAGAIAKAKRRIFGDGGNLFGGGDDFDPHNV